MRGAGYKKPIIGGGTSYDEFVLPFMGDEVIGDVSALQYSAALDTPKNAAFVKEYRAKFGKVPSYYSENNYTTAQMDRRGDQEGRRQMARAGRVHQASWSASSSMRCAGRCQLDEMRNPIQNIYIKKVEKKKMFGYDKDELWNTVIKTYPNVSQFWTVRKGQVPGAAGLRLATSRPASSANNCDSAGARSRPRRFLCSEPEPARD